MSEFDDGGVKIEGDYYILPHGVKIRTPQSLGIDPSDPDYNEQIAAYGEFFHSITGTLYDADKMNKLGLGAVATAATAGVVNSATGGSGGADGGNGGGDTSGTDSSGGNGDGGGITGFLNGLIPRNKDGSIDWGALGSDAISGLSAINAYQRQQAADKYANLGLDFAKQTYADNAPLRAAGRSGMLNPMANAPNLSGLRSIATTGSGNPFAGAPIPLRNAMPAPSAPQMPPARPPIPITPQAQHPVPIPTTPPSHLIPLSGASQAPTAAPSAAPSTPTPAMSGGQPMLSAQPIPLRTPIQPPKPRPIPLSFAQPPQPY